jgi:hypothetical protein
MLAEIREITRMNPFLATEQAVLVVPAVVPGITTVAPENTTAATTMNLAAISRAPRLAREPQSPPGVNSQQPRQPARLLPLRHRPLKHQHRKLQHQLPKLRLPSPGASSRQEPLESLSQEDSLQPAVHRPPTRALAALQAVNLPLVPAASPPPVAVNQVAPSRLPPAGPNQLLQPVVVASRLVVSQPQVPSRPEVREEVICPPTAVAASQPVKAGAAASREGVRPEARPADQLGPRAELGRVPVPEVKLLEQVLQVQLRRVALEPAKEPAARAPAQEQEQVAKVPGAGALPLAASLYLVTPLEDHRVRADVAAKVDREDRVAREDKADAAVRAAREDRAGAAAKVAREDKADRVDEAAKAVRRDLQVVVRLVIKGRAASLVEREELLAAKITMICPDTDGVKRNCAGLQIQGIITDQHDESVGGGKSSLGIHFTAED